VSDPTNTVQPGWYPDQNGHQRWWDGAQWTEHVQAPYDPEARALALKAPAGTKTGTVWVWLIVLLPILGFIPMLTVDWADYIDTMIQQSSGSIGYGTSGMYGTPVDLLSNVIAFVSYGITVGLAALDARALKQRGVQQPFHWAFAFLTNIVYVIGRSVVVKRRTGGGLAPLWVFIALTVVSIIVVIVFTVVLFQAFMAAVPFPVR
jgi:hypothetical protein